MQVQRFNRITLNPTDVTKNGLQLLTKLAAHIPAGGLVHLFIEHSLLGLRALCIRISEIHEACPVKDEVHIFRKPLNQAMRLGKRCTTLETQNA